MSDKKFTLEDLYILLINLMNKNIKENKSSIDNNINSEKEEPKNIIQEKEVSSQKKNKNHKNKKTHTEYNIEKLKTKNDNRIINKKNKNEDDKESNEDDEANGNSGILYKYNDDKNKIYYYLFHRKKNNKTDLRCKDRKCRELHI